MIFRKLCTVLAIGGFVAAVVPAAIAADKDDARPNLVIIVADDMGYGDIASFGSEIRTPNLDRLAAEGTKFTNFHVGAACSPTRSMLMTGVDNHLAGLGNMLEIQADNQFGKPGYEGHLNDRVVTIARRLRDAGYHTYMVGKWHLGGTKDTIPHARGFEKTFALMESGADNYVEMPYMPIYKAVHYFENGKPVKLPTENYYSSDFYTNRIIENIEEHRKDGKPFLAYVAYQAVHYPHQVPIEFIEKYDGVYDAGYEAIRRQRLARQKEMGLVSAEVELDTKLDKMDFPQLEIAPWDGLTDEEKKFNIRRMQTYAGMADNMDGNIGKILAYLEKVGEADNTLVLFFSDNGADPNQVPMAPGYRPWYEQHYRYTYMSDYKGDFTLMGQKGSYADYGPGWAAVANAPTSYYKTFSTEGGIRSPFLAWFPGKIPAGKTSTSFAFIKDVAPTLLEVAGVPKGGDTYEGKKVHPITGTSMWSALRGESKQVHSASENIGYELAGSSAIFRGRHKLVQNLPPKGTGGWELYDTVADPSEIHDLAKKNPELVKELEAAYASYVKANNVIPVPPGYNPNEQGAKNAERGLTH